MPYLSVDNDNVAMIIFCQSVDTNDVTMKISHFSVDNVNNNAAMVANAL